MAKLQLFIQDYDKWADEQAAKWDLQNQMEGVKYMSKTGQWVLGMQEDALG